MMFDDSTPQMATLEITRQKRMADRFRSYRIVIDGSSIGEIRQGHTSRLSVTPGRHELHLEIDWARSATIALELDSGEIVRIACWSNVKLLRAAAALADPNNYIGVARTE